MNKKVALVTGASDGLGREISYELSKQGVTVILLAKNQSKLEAVYDRIEKNKYTTPVLYPLDLSCATEEGYLSLASAIKGEFNKLNMLVHNAAMFGEGRRIIDIKATMWQKIIQTNLNSSFFLCKYLYPLLKMATNSNICFTLDKKNTAFYGAYGISKSAQKTFVEILSSEMKDENIKINGIIPPPMCTNMRAQSHPGDDFRTLKSPTLIAKKYIKIMQTKNTKPIVFL
jgi:NAD(P)-dependent dehydrogenase (short-subunit alcohol dehydrogenase family)